MDKTLEYNGVLHNIISESKDRNSRRLTTDTIRDRTFFAFLPVWIECPFGDDKSLKLRWLRKVTTVERLYLISLLNSDPEWSGNVWWDDFYGQWCVEDIK